MSPTKKHGKWCVTARLLRSRWRRTMAFLKCTKEVDMQPQESEENVFGENDGSSYSATLRQEGGVWYCSSFVVDEHNILLNGETWPTRETALQAIRRIASGDRAPL